jgi:hypothetical protein
MLLNPLAWISAKVMGCTGGLFQEPSVGIASRVFPRFHPGFSPANASLAVIGTKGVVQIFVAATEAVLDRAVDMLAIVDAVAALLIGSPGGVHWE